MKIKDIRQKTDIELKELLKKTRKDISEVTMKLLQGTEKNVKKPRLMRKDIARIITVIKERVAQKND